MLPLRENTSIEQVRTIRYREIAEELRGQIANGNLVAGQVLPSEAELSKSHSVSRVTIRKALELLRQDGLVDARQGFGWFVAIAPLKQPLAQLGTIEGQLIDWGVPTVRKVLEFSFVPAPKEARDAFGANTVLQVRRVNLANGVPFARVTVWCPEELGANLSRSDVEKFSFYEALEVELGDATQIIGAGVASEADAQVLDIPVNSPVLVCHRTTRNKEGHTILVSEHIFPAHLTHFVVELPHVADPDQGGGMWLLDETT